MKNLWFLLWFGAFTLLGLVSNAQEYDDDDFFMVDYDTPLTLDLDAEDDAGDTLRSKKKKKTKKNVFYGRKTKKTFSKTGFGNSLVIEQFYYLKKHEAPDPYVRDVFWYDFKKKKITNNRNYDPDKSGILHGPYRKMLGDQVIEEGIFYLGMRHGRWVRFNRHDILQDKEKFYKGWPKESKVTYWDNEKKQLKEVIPVQFGEKEGYYYAFHENGTLAAMGEYHFDQKVGIWREFYPERNRRKREIIYSDLPFDKQHSPVITKEWDRKGRIIYDRDKFLRTRL